MAQQFRTMPVKEVNPYSHEVKKHANKKTVLLIIVLTIVVVAAGLAIYYSLPRHRWIKENIDGSKELKIGAITGEAAYVDDGGNQQYDTEDIGTVFKYEGWYQGYHFFGQYVEDGKVLMRINKEMNPNDGVIEGYIVHKIENNEPYAYIFLDEDWKNKVANTKIYWGMLYENEIVYDFSEQIAEGIYMHKIKDDKERFSEGYANHIGGIWVGELKDTPDGTLIASN